MPSREIKPRMLVKALLKAGFVIKRQRGSHVFIECSKNNEVRRTSISLHNKPIPYGTLRAILKQADLSFEELDALL